MCCAAKAPTMRRSPSGAARLPLALISCTGEDSAALLERGPDGWHRRAAWPYPPDARAQRWQRILSWPPLCR
jgi:hypothetical protein